MLKAVIRFSLRYSSLVLIAAAMLLGYAGNRLPQMGVDVFPELNAPTVTIMAEAGGLAADEVEQYVTFPIETAVNGMSGVRRVRSSSAIGLGIIWIDLNWGADLIDARQLVSERLVAARENLPDGVEPFITPITSIAGEIMPSERTDKLVYVDIAVTVFVNRIQHLSCTDGYFELFVL